MKSALAAALRFGAALGFVLAAGAAEAQAGWWDEAARARETTVAEVRASPDRWRDVTVALVVRAAGPATAAAPAEYPASEWRAFAAAPHRAAAPPPADAPCDRFFARRGSAEEARLAAAESGREVRVRAVVRVVDGSAAFEVVDVAGPADALAPEELAALARAEDLAARDNPAAAAAICRSILGGRDLAPALRAELHRRIAVAERAAGRPAEAAAALRAALRDEPAHRAAAAELARVEAALAAAAPPAHHAAPPAGTSARDAAPMPKAPPIPVPVPAVRLAPPRDADPAPAAAAPRPSAPSAPSAPPAPSAPSAPSAPPAPALPAPAEEPPPAPRLAPPK